MENTLLNAVMINILANKPRGRATNVNIAYRKERITAVHKEKYC
jgi:hypothetical protein